MKHDEPNVALDAARQIDLICDDFEDQWSEENSSDFASFLSRVAPEHVTDLLRQLLLVDVELKNKHLQPVRSQDYSSVHPDAVGIVEAFIESLSDRTVFDTEVEFEPLLSKARIGSFVLVEEIGHGGMGVVWKAQQTEPIERILALKVIKTGLNSRQAVARFNAERQALAKMNHPNIATIVDAGTTPNGQPYFAMEFVDGIPITKYCRTKELTTRERLQLMMTVCSAVKHAHQKGIIHRDLKPSNILVCEIDGVPVPKVIDFGLAKALQGTDASDLAQTQFGQVIGSLLYMSPEQAGLNDSDVDTRTDVYSLGVILFEMLVGETPVGMAAIQGKTLPEVLELVRERPQSRASLVLSRLSETGDTNRLNAELKGELDWILLKTLEKDRERRYQSASELEDEINRFLHDEPIQARPPSRAYLTQKYLKRHRLKAIAAALLCFTLIAGTIGTTTGWISARNRAEGERLAKEKSLKRLALVEKSNLILTSVFDDLRSARLKPDSEPLEAVLAERLLKASKTIDKELIDDPLTLAKMQNRMGESLVELGYPKDGVRLLRESLETQSALLGKDHIEVLLATRDVAYGLNHLDQHEEALTVLKEVVPLLIERLGADHEDTLIAMVRLAHAHSQANEYQKSLELFEIVHHGFGLLYGEADKRTISVQVGLAGNYLSLGNVPLAIEQYENARELMKQSNLYVGEDLEFRGFNGLSAAYRMSGRMDESLEMCHKAYEFSKKESGKNHPRTLRVADQLGGIYLTLKQPEKALPVMEEAFVALKERFDETSPPCMRIRDKIVAAHMMLKHFDSAFDLNEKLLEDLSPRQPSRNVLFVCDIARGSISARDFDSAKRYGNRFFELLSQAKGPELAKYEQGLQSIVWRYQDEEKYEEALHWCERLIETRAGHCEIESFRMQFPLALKGRYLLWRGDWKAAIPLLEKGFAFSKNEPELEWTRETLSKAYKAAGRDADAEALLD